MDHGFTTQFGIEDANDINGATNRVNFDGNIGCTQDMFFDSLSGVAHAYTDADYGHTVAAQASVNLMDNPRVGLSAFYGQSALTHLNLFENKAGFTNAGEAKGFVVAAAMKLGLTDMLTAPLDASCAKLDHGSADWNQTNVNGSSTYSPAAGLEFVLDAGYSKDSLDKQKCIGCWSPSVQLLRSLRPLVPAVLLLEPLDSAQV